ncbi:helix-turn-helix transcriptional regulator [Deinococcus yunweiensis]|uniref:S24 family peptidase n=1 Tax=Deinococcus yunweiensis TaxID=367282 RepID=UPI00398F420B
MQSFFLPRRYAPSKATVIGYVSAGVALDPNPFGVRRQLSIPHPFRRFGMAILHVTGDSMTLPDGSGIPDGAMVLFDRRDIMTSSGHVYAFQHADGSYSIKRLALHQGRPAMYSDNPSFPPAHLTSSVRNIGRVYAVSLDGQNWRPSGYRSWN